MSPLPLSQLRITGELGLIVFLSLVKIEFASGKIKLLLSQLPDGEAGILGAACLHKD